VLLHAVSVGEVNALRTLVPMLLGQGHRVTIASTTDTGVQRATSLFGDAASVVRYPLDLSIWVARFLDSIQPDVVGLMELEVWPNFTGACARRAIPLQVISGRLSARSFRRYGRLKWLVRPMFRRLSGVHAQDEAIKARFTALGVDPSRVQVVQGLKWDAVTVGHMPEGAAAFGQAMGIDPAKALVVVGSSAPEEHALLRDAVPKGVQLLCAPRRPEWWNDAAEVLDGCVRRSAGTVAPAGTDRFVLDTIGELSLAYALADVIVLGRSFGDRHGSDPVEPLAMGKAVLCGPAMGDFQPAMRALRAAEAIEETTASALPETLAALLGDATRRLDMATRGAQAIGDLQGGSARAAEALIRLAANRLTMHG
jgi:3-deoxy-D-manno-octulosonic-acid transferase